MANVYATLIIKGVKTFEQVPNTIKLQVTQRLIDLECESLIPADYITAHSNELTGLE